MLKIIITGKTAQELSEQMADIVAEFTQGQVTISQTPPVISALVTQAPVIPQVVQNVPTQVAPPPQPTMDVNSGVDSRGFPWDARIHSSSKEKTKKGAWRYRRNIEDPEINAVEATLPRGGPSAVAVVAQPQAAAVHAAPPIPQAAPAQMTFAPPPLPSQFVGQPVAPQLTQAPQQFTPTTPSVVPPNATVAPALPPMPGTRPAHDFASFKETLIPTVSRLVEEKKITQDYLNQVLSYFKVKQLWDMNDQQIAEFLNTLAAAELIIKVGG